MTTGDRTREGALLSAIPPDVESSVRADADRKGVSAEPVLTYLAKVYGERTDARSETTVQSCPRSGETWIFASGCGLCTATTDDKGNTVHEINPSCRFHGQRSETVVRRSPAIPPRRLHPPHGATEQEISEYRAYEAGREYEIKHGVGRRVDEIIAYCDAAKIEAEKRGRVSGEPLAEWIARLPLDVDHRSESAPCAACGGRGWLNAGNPHDQDERVACPDCDRPAAPTFKAGDRVQRDGYGAQTVGTVRSHDQKLWPYVVFDDGSESSITPWMLKRAEPRSETPFSDESRTWVNRYMADHRYANTAFETVLRETAFTAFHAGREQRRATIGCVEAVERRRESAQPDEAYGRQRYLEGVADGRREQSSIAADTVRRLFEAELTKLRDEIASHGDGPWIMAGCLDCDREHGPCESHARRQATPVERPDVDAQSLRAMAAHLEKLGEEPCPECDYSLNEIRNYVKVLVAARELLNAIGFVRYATNAEVAGDEGPHVERLAIAETSLRAAVDRFKPTSSALAAAAEE